MTLNIPPKIRCRIPPIFHDKVISSGHILAYSPNGRRRRRRRRRRAVAIPSFNLCLLSALGKRRYEII